MTITFSLIWIPTIITVVGLFWALVVVKGEGYMGSLANILALIPVLFISMISWIVYAIFK